MYGYLAPLLAPPVVAFLAAPVSGIDRPIRHPGRGRAAAAAPDPPRNALKSTFSELAHSAFDSAVGRELTGIFFPGGNP